MYLINIALKPNNDDEQTAAKRFALHREWFAKYFDNGTFLLLGPYLDRDHSGVIIAQAKNKAELEKVIAEDVYYPLGTASYEISEFKPVMIANNIANYLEK